MSYTPPPQPYVNGPQQPYYGPPQGFRPPYPPKKKPVWPWIVGAVGLIFVFLVVVGAASGGNTNKAETTAAATVQRAAASSAPAASPEVSAPQATTGQAVRDGQFEFTVTKVEQGATTLGSGMFAENAKGEFVVVHLHVTNTGTSQRTLYSSNQKLTDQQGRKFDADTGVDLALDDNDTADLNPGLSVDRVVAFDVPKGDAIQSIQLHDSAFSGGVKVSVSN